MLNTGVLDVDIHTGEGPVSVVYKWMGPGRERFLVSFEMTGDKLMVFNLWIPKSRRRQGLGSNIIELLLSAAGDFGIPRIVIEPRPGSEGFWESQGFAPVNAQRYYHWERKIE